MNDLDQSLVFPYHVEQDLFDTHFVVENRSADIKVLKVRVWGSQGGHLVSSFHLFVPAYYQWSAALSELDEGLVLNTKDPACTVPAGHFVDSQGLDINLISVQLMEDEQPLNLARSGNVEVTELGLLKEETLYSAHSKRQVDTQMNCAGFNTVWNDHDDSNLWMKKLTNELLPPSGGLSGQAEIRSLLQDESAYYQAVAMNYIYRPKKGNWYLSERKAKQLEPNLTHYLGSSVLALNVSE